MPADGYVSTPRDIEAEVLCIAHTRLLSGSLAEHLSSGAARMRCQSPLVEESTFEARDLVVTGCKTLH